MQRTIRALALCCGLLAVAACSHKDKNAPLAFAPVDTPYLIANLEPLDDATQAALMDQAGAQLPATVAQLRQTADRLQAAHKPDLAGLMRALAAEYDGKTAQQVAADSGIDSKGRMALFGIGLSPVLRADLADPARFKAFIGRLEHGYGHTLVDATLDKQAYRHLRLDALPLQVVIAIEGKQAVLALLPADADPNLLRRALGLVRPDKSAQDARRLATMAKANGYQPYVVGYLDTTRLPALLADGKDPMVQALYRGAVSAYGDGAAMPAQMPAMPASCRGEFERIAARVPLLSFGYETLDAKQATQRIDIALAPDIVQAFSGVKAALPGLGSDLDAPFDLALALPVEEIRTFWTAQADAVAAKPFTCPALTDLNAQFAKLGQDMQKTAIPPVGDLRGVRMAIDSFVAGSGGAMPQVSGRVLVASRNPAGLLAMAQAAVPVLAQVKLGSDGQPVALPAQLTAMAQQPGWAAMNDDALAVGVGAGEDAKLADMLKAPGGAAGSLFKMHIDGDMYRKWIALMADRLAAAAAAQSAAGAPDDGAGKRAAAQFDDLRKQAERIKQVDVEAHVDDRGLVIVAGRQLR
jgi:hypothetical protein